MPHASANLALDYVSRLARHGAIVGERVSGIWFVDLTSLKKFVAEQERQKELLRVRSRRCVAKNSASPDTRPQQKLLAPVPVSKTRSVCLGYTK
jgi:hypothetical protein